jgi:hypothetical protein
LKTYTNTNASNKRGNLWYDGRGRVWQRWQDHTVTGAWDLSLTRFVYDGSTLAQEHYFTPAQVSNEWVYSYQYVTYDYLRQPGGIRQKERDGASYKNYFLQANTGIIEFKDEWALSPSVTAHQE